MIPIGGPEQGGLTAGLKITRESLQARAEAWARGTTRGGVEWGAFGAAFAEKDFVTGAFDAGLFAGFRARW